MVPTGSIVADWATGIGLAAGLMAICGFLAHAKPVFRRADESEIRIATVMGGLGGLAIACLLVAIQYLST
jgi:hypothetical protein